MDGTKTAVGWCTCAHGQRWAAPARGCEVPAALPGTLPRCDCTAVSVILCSPGELGRQTQKWEGR